MIHPRFQPIVFGFYMSFLMSFLMSFFITFINLGWIDHFVMRWLTAWVPTFAIAFPLVVFVSPLVRRLVAWTIKAH